MNQTAIVCVLTDERIHARVLDASRAVMARSRAAYHVPNSLCTGDEVGPLAEAIAEAVNQLGHGGPITLVIPLQWSFAEVLSAPAGKATSKALGYVMEEFLPLPLEDVTVSFVPCGNGHVLGVAVPTAPMLRLLTSLSRHGTEVAHLTVDVIALSDCGDSSETSDVRATILLDARWRRIAILNGNACVAAFDAGADSPEISLRERIHERSPDEAQPRSWTVLDVREASQARNLEKELRIPPEQLHYLCGEEAIDVLAGAAARSSLDLRKGALEAPGRWATILHRSRQCAAIMAVVLVVWVMAMFAESRVLKRQGFALDAARLAAYGEAFAANELPPGASLRLASERLRLAGLTQRASRQSTMDTLAPLVALRDSVANLPADVRLRLLDARVDERQFQMRGRTDEHRAAERVAEAVGRVAGLAVQPPRSTRLDGGGVEFSVVATAKRSGDER